MRNFVYWLEDCWPILAGLAAILVVIVLMIVALEHDAKRWLAFSEEHHCKVVAHVTGDTFTTIGFTGNGQMAVGVGSTPVKTGWLCDDGVTYFR